MSTRLALLAVISLHWLFVVSRATLSYFKIAPEPLTALLDLFSISIFLAFTTALVIRGLAQLRLFAGIEEPRRSRASSLPATQSAALIVRLERLMEEEKPHLQPSLTLEQLAGRLGIPPWQLSQLLNQGLELSFFHFINRYRVRAAARQLADPARNEKTVLRILYEAGFNSKSTFNEAFKRHMGMTPRDYRRQQPKPAPKEQKQPAPAQL